MWKGLLAIGSFIASTNTISVPSQQIPATISRKFAENIPLVPQDGKILLGSWLDTTPGRDSPASFNERLGFYGSFFQFAQNIPLDFNNPPPVQLIDQTNTNAIMYLTVYPITLESVTPKAITDFVKQIAGFTKNGRAIFIRLAPEMNGSWFRFGQKPTAFVNMWINVVRAIRANPLCTGRVAFIWAPNIGFGYPFKGGAYSFNSTTGPDFTLLDTNNNGEYDSKDDPYKAFYPGDEYVDWVGLSTYWFGPNFPFDKNLLPNSTVFSDLLTGVNDDAKINFYDLYSTKRNKPFFIPESGAAFHQYFLRNPTASLDPGPGELAIKQAFWRQYITNPDIIKEFPNLKAICMFEYTKEEELTMRDFEITKPGTPILESFKKDLQKVEGNFAFATKNTDSTPKAPPGQSNGLSSPLGVMAYFLVILVNILF